MKDHQSEINAVNWSLMIPSESYAQEARNTNDHESKDYLERKKLQAEIADIERGPIKEKLARGVENRKLYGTLFSVIVVLVVGVLPVWQTWQQQIENQINEQRFKETRVMVDLLEKLKPTNKSEEKRVAALTLAHFGEPAIDVLVEQLNLGHAASVNRAISKSLITIIRQFHKPTRVLKALTASAQEKIANNACGHDKLKYQTSIKAHLGVLEDIKLFLKGDPRKDSGDDFLIAYNTLNLAIDDLRKVRC